MGSNWLPNINDTIYNEHGEPCKKITTMTENAIHNVLNALVGHVEQENIDLYKKLMDVNAPIQMDTIEGFYFRLLYPHQQFLEGLIKTEIANNDDIVFLYINSDYVQQHFEKRIKELDGWPCCADKSRTIMKALVAFYKDGTEISWNHEAEYTYHLPKNIFITHQEIIDFYVSIRFLFYGNAEKYFALMQPKTISDELDDDIEAHQIYLAIAGISEQHQNSVNQLFAKHGMHIKHISELAIAANRLPSIHIVDDLKETLEMYIQQMPPKDSLVEGIAKHFIEKSEQHLTELEKDIGYTAQPWNKKNRHSSFIDGKPSKKSKRKK